MSFTKPIYTTRGKQIELMGLQGQKIIFTKIKVGDGTITNQTPSELMDLISVVASAPLVDIKRYDTYVSIRATFQNADIPDSFWWREIGLYAIDPATNTEILYAYQNAYETAEYISPASLVTKKINFTIYVDDGSKLGADVHKDMVYCSIADIVEHDQDEEAHPYIQGLIEDHINDEEAHPDIFNKYLPLAGGTMTGSIAVSGSDGSIVSRNSTSKIDLEGGTKYKDGARLTLYGGDNPTSGGTFTLASYNKAANAENKLIGDALGALTWNGADVITAIGGTMTGTALIKKDTDTQSLELLGGTSWESNPALGLYGQNHASYGGAFLLNARKGTQRYALFGKPDGTLTWGGVNVITGTVADSSTAATDSSKKLATTEWVKKADNPIGTVIYSAGASVPSGYLVCNGQAVSRTTYASLYAVIGTKYGSGNGSTTFTLPNLIDKVAQGSSTAGTYKAAGLPNITGYFNGDAYGKEWSDLLGGAFYQNGSIASGALGNGGSYDGKYTFDASRSNSIYGNSTTVQPPALTLLPCIKY